MWRVRRPHRSGSGAIDRHGHDCIALSLFDIVLPMQSIASQDARSGLHHTCERQYRREPYRGVAGCGGLPNHRGHGFVSHFRERRPAAECSPPASAKGNLALPSKGWTIGSGLTYGHWERLRLMHRSLYSPIPGSLVFR